MKIQRPKKFRLGRTADEIINYLEVYLSNTLSDVTTILSNISFQDNFKSMEVETNFAAGAETQIQHDLKFVPSGYLILKSSGVGLCDGPTAWTKDYIYLLNSSGTIINAKIIILR